MLQFKADHDRTAQQLGVLSAQLDRCLNDAGAVRLRLLKARDANAWPVRRRDLSARIPLQRN